MYPSELGVQIDVGPLLGLGSDYHEARLQESNSGVNSAYLPERLMFIIHCMEGLVLQILVSTHIEMPAQSASTCISRKSGHAKLVPH